jgi:hypothetical protein
VSCVIKSEVPLFRKNRNTWILLLRKCVFQHWNLKDLDTETDRKIWPAHRLFSRVRPWRTPENNQSHPVSFFYSPHQIFRPWWWFRAVVPNPRGSRKNINNGVFFCLHNLHNKVTVKQSHYTPWRRWGRGGKALLSQDLVTGWGWVVSVMLRPLFYPRYPLDRRLGGPQSRSGHRG